MSETRIPGLKSGHQIITPVCRVNRGSEPAFIEAVLRLQKLYDRYAASEGSENVNWHLVLVREEPQPRGETPCPSK